MLWMWRWVVVVVVILSLASGTAQGQREVISSLSSSNSLDVPPQTFVTQPESSSLDGNNLRNDFGDENAEEGGRRGGRGRRGWRRKRGLFTWGSFRFRSANRAGNDGT